jgi:hypothetical protein
MCLYKAIIQESEIEWVAVSWELSRLHNLAWLLNPFDKVVISSHLHFHKQGIRQTAALPIPRSGSTLQLYKKDKPDFVVPLSQFSRPMQHTSSDANHASGTHFFYWDEAVWSCGISRFIVLYCLQEPFSFHSVRWLVPHQLQHWPSCCVVLWLECQATTCWPVSFDCYQVPWLANFH